ncbi:ABC transporter permease [Halanaerobium hydrogeniformans]|uniref:Binding-protein-dependent transport systems inner membrane component n=1 Tax=Halanaerobium hydrogeniformans TaxID=656519 RepID=E4RJS0_HALHG|nr:iron ABC transporter permease [Halanaerobium hydrogeniformans]ADQ15490.1 binding-protein-dependent transport systems inner membrane component [Halanaerobium hydrogeniformans]
MNTDVEKNNFKNLIQKIYWKGHEIWPFQASLFILIPVFLLTTAMSLPLIYLFIRAWGTENFLNLLLRERTFSVLLNTVKLAASVTLSSIVIAVPIAYLTVRTDLPGARIWTVLTMLPLVIPSLVGGFAFVAAFGYGGIVHNFLRNGLNIFYVPEIYGFRGAWLLLTLLSYPYVLLSVRGALQGMDSALEEAAQTMGKSPWKIFWKVVLPQLRPAIMAGGLMVALYTLSDFAAVSLLQFNSFTRAIYVQYQSSFNRHYASALALLLVLLTVIILSFEMWSRTKARYYKVGSGSRCVAKKIKLGKAKIPALIFLSVVVFFSLVLPTGVILYWLIRGLIHGEAFILRWQAALNSFYVSGLAAIVGVIVTVPLAILITRYKSKVTNLLEKMTYVAFALPGIVVALALVFFAANYAIGIYQTLPLLIFAYVILFLPQAMGPLRNSLLQLGPNIEDAASTLGSSKFRVLVKITLPLIKPGILSAVALVFLTAMKELPATLLLSPIGFRTLTTEIWNATSEAFYARAAGPALLLLIISSFSMWILFKQNE